MQTQAQQIEKLAYGRWSRALHKAVYTEHGVNYRVKQITRAPRVLVYSLLLASTADLRKLTSARTEEAVALALGTDAVRIVRYHGVVNIEAQLPPAYHVTLPVDAVPLKGRLWFSAGQTTTGHPVHVNMGGSRYPHALVAATTGAGKTWLLRLLLWELVINNDPDEVQILLIDGKGGLDYNGQNEMGFDIRNVPHLLHLATEPDDALAALAWSLTEMDRRKRDGTRKPEIFILIDEIRAILEATGGKDGKAAEAVKDLTSIGRGLGIHVIAATQHPKADTLGGSIASANLPLRLAGRVLTADASALVTGQKDMQAHRLYGKGDFLAVDGETAHRFQVAALTSQALAELPRGAQPRHLDFAGLDLSRVLDVTSTQYTGPTPEQIAWGLADIAARGESIGASATQFRETFGGGTPQASASRDFIRSVWQGLRSRGYALRPYSED